jgi:foldase protein PrsA
MPRCLLLTLLLVACSSTNRSPASRTDGDTDGARSSTGAAVAAGLGDRRPPAMVDGAPIAFDALWPAVAEAGGGDALREVVLDRQLSLELTKRGIAVNEADAEAERTLLLESLSTDANAAARVLDELRRRDRLGPARFSALLRRNASLRALVRDQANVSEEAIAVAYDLTAGPKRQIRIIAAPSLASAESAAARVRSGASFADVAVEVSSDSSAARGGLLEPFARQDPSYPESLRAAAFALRPGEVSTPTLLSQGYVIATLVRDVPPTNQSLEALRPQLERAVRLTQERLLMDQLARRLLRETRVTVFDDSLNWAWSGRS